MYINILHLYRVIYQACSGLTPIFSFNNEFTEIMISMIFRGNIHT